MIKPSKRMELFAPSVFASLQNAIKEKEAKNEQTIINLSIGSPDIPPNPIIREKLADESLKENTYGYTLTGIDAFHEAVANYYKRRMDVEVNPSNEIIQTMGSQEALVHLPMAFCDEGDVVLTTNPAYIAYETGIKLAGAKIYELPLRKENRYMPNIKAIPESVLEKTKMIILNMPGNPVPAMPEEALFRELIEVAKKYNILIVHDAAYAEYYFSGNKPFSFLQINGAKEVGIEVNSLSKSFSLAGARIAYIVGNEQVISIMKEFKSNLDYGVFQPIQEAAIVALNHAEEITDRLRNIFKKRHEIVFEGLKKANWDIVPSNGGMFIWAKYPYQINSTNLAIQLIRDIGIVTVPGISFGSEGEGYVRIALVQDEATLIEAIERIKRFTIKKE